MRKIEPDIDRYGTLARASFFADFLEIVTLRDGRVKLASLRDLISDTYPGVQRILRPAAGQDLGDDWTPADLADEAWTCILQRADILGDRYPFKVRREVLHLREDVNLLQSTYLSLLAITVAHAFNLMAKNVVEHLLEDVVGDAIENVGLKVGRLGPLSRANGFNFTRTMEALGTVLGIPVNPNAVPRRKNANDEGADIVAHLDWGDVRRGRWLFVGQVTCAVSDDWRAKAQEPSVRDWQAFFGEVVQPTPFLAVPHHAEDLAFEYVTSKDVNLLDRTRIALQLHENSQGQKDAIQALLDADYASFRV